ncbi:hypothetical protein [Salininema proteolyticum]|uniref:HEPN domain-containing protein n=1 Tax=Salininema proteolyticum TaxID=1607685 RepID=A0ABV8TT65_9ACTN
MEETPSNGHSIFLSEAADLFENLGSIDHYDYSIRLRISEFYADVYFSRPITAEVVDEAFAKLREVILLSAGAPGH